MGLTLARTRARAARDRIADWEAQGEAIDASRLLHVPAVDRDVILTPRRKALDEALERVYESGRFDEAQAALLAYDEGLLRDSMAYYERQRKAASDGIEDLAPAFADGRYHDLELIGLRALLEPGERVQRARWLGVDTNKRTILRTEMREAARPSSWSNSSSWEHQFVDMRELERLEAVGAVEPQQDVPQYGINTDYPRGVRP